LWPQSTFPSEAPGAKYDQRLTPTHRGPTMQPPRWQSVRSGFWGVRCGGLPGKGETSALRCMAAGAEFLCGVLGDGVASALRWMWMG
ncbi:hypothetical protein LKD46_14575, partial [Blautia sp. CLA-AA-H275]|nr:hypothetical protein [Blautia fusiformis]